VACRPLRAALLLLPLLLLALPTAQSLLPVGPSRLQQVSRTLQSQAASCTSCSLNPRQQQQHLPARLTLQQHVVHRSPQHRLLCTQHTPRLYQAHLAHASRAAAGLLLLLLLVLVT
jgi:hypothetical protein